MKEKKQIAVIGYYNVLYFINIKSELDRVKIEYMMNRIKAGEKIFMRDIQKWCMAQSLGYKTHFIYRKDFPLKANAWNFYSYVRFIFIKSIQIQKHLAAFVVVYFLSSTYRYRECIMSIMAYIGIAYLIIL